MRLTRVLEQDLDSYHANAAKPNVLKLQQALIEAGDWECEFERPKPFDQETGEIFPWIITATNEVTGNKLKFKVSSSFITAKLGLQSLSLDPNSTMEQWAKEIKEGYDSAFAAFDEDVYSWFDGDISRSDIIDLVDDELESEEYSRVERWSEKAWAHALRTVKWGLERKYLQAELRDWNLHFISKSNGLINSKKLADAYIKKIKESFEDAWNRVMG